MNILSIRIGSIYTRQQIDFAKSIMYDIFIRKFCQYSLSHENRFIEIHMK